MSEAHPKPINLEEISHNPIIEIEPAKTSSSSSSSSPFLSPPEKSTPDATTTSAKRQTDEIRRTAASLADDIPQSTQGGGRGEDAQKVHLNDPSSRSSETPTNSNHHGITERGGDADDAPSSKTQPIPSITTDANIAPDGATPPGQTALQKHAAFFDINGDGVILPWETYQSLRSLGYAIPTALFGTMVVHIFMSYASLDTWVPDPFFGIEIKNIHRCKHGSDTGIYDLHGNFDQSQFEKKFGKPDLMHIIKDPFGKSYTNAYHFSDIWNFTNHLRLAFDPFGWCASKLEWIFLYLLGDGQITKDLIIGSYDGSAFIKKQQEYQQATNPSSSPPDEASQTA
jgi:peroxygenase